MSPGPGLAPVHLLHFIAFLDLFAVGLIIPLVGNHVRELGGTHIFVGLMGSLYSGFQLGSGPLIGSLSDLKGRKTILVGTLLLCSGAYILMGLTTSIAFLLILRVFLGMFKQTQMLTKALVPDYERNEVKQSIIYGKMAAISGGGITLGPIVGGHIMEDFPKYGFLVNATVAGLLFIVNAGLLWFLKSPKGARKRKPQPTIIIPSKFLNMAWNSLKQSVTDIYSIQWSIYWDVFLFKALVGFCMGVYYSSYSLVLKSQFNLTPKYIGYTISFQGIIGSLCSYCIAFVNKLYQNDYDYTGRNLHCFVFMTISLIGMALSLNIYMYVPWLIPLAISNAVGRLISLEMVLKKSSGQHRGTLIGASNSVRSLSGVVAPMLAGFLSDYYGVSYVLYAAICSSLLGLILSFHVRLKSQRQVQNIKVD